MSRDPSHEDNGHLFFAKDHCHQQHKPEVVLEALHPELLPPLMPSDSLADPNYPAHLMVTSLAHCTTLSHSVSLRSNLCLANPQHRSNVS